MLEYHGPLVRAVLTEKAAGRQQEVADGCRPGFAADEEKRAAWRREEDAARGVWRGQRAAAWAATKAFLARNGR